MSFWGSKCLTDLECGLDDSSPKFSGTGRMMSELEPILLKWYLFEKAHLDQCKSYLSDLPHASRRPGIFTVRVHIAVCDRNSLQADLENGYQALSVNWNTVLSFSPHRTRLGTIIIAIVFVLLSLFCKCLESFGDLLKVTCPGNIKSRI